MDSDYFFEFVKPVYFISNDWGCWGSGTSFFVKFDGRVYLVTAEHVFACQPNAIAGIHISLRGSSKGVQFDGVFRYKKIDKKGVFEDEDLVVLRVSEQCEHAERLKESAFLLPHFLLFATSLQAGEHVFVCGYPVNGRGLDDSGKVIADEFLFREGVYACEEHDRHRLKSFPSDYPLSGISGSPVFAKRHGLGFLVGMVVSSKDDGTLMNFISSECILDLILGVDKC